MKTNLIVKNKAKNIYFAEQTVPWHRLRNSQQHLTVQQRRQWMRKLSVPCMDRTKNGPISMQEVLQTSREFICIHSVLRMKLATINLYILWNVFKLIPIYTILSIYDRFNYYIKHCPWYTRSTQYWQLNACIVYPHFYYNFNSVARIIVYNHICTCLYM